MAEEPKPLGKRLFRNWTGRRLHCNIETDVEVFVLRSCNVWDLNRWTDGVVYYLASDTDSPLTWYVVTREEFDEEFEFIS